MRTFQKPLVMLVIMLMLMVLVTSVSRASTRRMQASSLRLGIGLKVFRLSPEVLVDLSLDSLMIRSHLGYVSRWQNQFSSGQILSTGIGIYSAPMEFNWGMIRQVRFGGGAGIHINVKSSGTMTRRSTLSFYELSANSILDFNPILKGKVKPFLEARLSVRPGFSGAMPSFRLGITF
ncbi:MAG: hypothetical protein V5A57_01895 [Candidatus Paceibacterota bacterium]